MQWITQILIIPTIYISKSKHILYVLFSNSLQLRLKRPYHQLTGHTDVKAPRDCCWRLRNPVLKTLDKAISNRECWPRTPLNCMYYIFDNKTMNYALHKMLMILQKVTTTLTNHWSWLKLREEQKKKTSIKDERMPLWFRMSML